MKKVTSMTLFDTSAGRRLSITYSEISDTGQILRSNIRVDRILVTDEMIAHADALAEYAQSIVSETEG